MEQFPSIEPNQTESEQNTEKVFEPVSQEDVRKGAKLYFEARKGEFIEVEVISDIKQTKDVTPKRICFM